MRKQDERRAGQWNGRPHATNPAMSAYLRELAAYLRELASECVCRGLGLEPALTREKQLKLTVPK